VGERAMTGVSSESSVPTFDMPNLIRTFLRTSPVRKIDDPLTILCFAAPVLGRANDSWSATGRAIVALLFGAVVASTSFLDFPIIAAFVGNGTIQILVLKMLWTTL